MADGSPAATIHPVVQAARDGICAHCGKQLPLQNDGNPVGPYFCGLACFYGKIEADKLKALSAPAVEETSCIVCGKDCGTGGYCSQECADWDNGDCERSVGGTL